MTFRKAGLHIINGYTGDLGRPPLVKLVNASPAYVREVRGRVGPDCLIIVRWVDADYFPLDNPAQRAKDWFNRHSGEIWAMTDQGNDTAIVFEGYNERPSSQADGYAHFEIERLKWLHDIGAAAAVGQWSVGEPEIDVERRFVERVRPEMLARDIYDKHEYWIDRADMGNVWHVLRWLMVPELADVPLVISEAGRDIVENKGKAGWRATCNSEQIMDEFRHYDALMCGHPNVIGWTPYTFGRIEQRWRDFDCNALGPLIVAEMEAPLPRPKPQPKPEPKPEPAPMVISRAEIVKALRGIEAAASELAAKVGEA